jgi:voltage-gated potassium channel
VVDEERDTLLPTPEELREQVTAFADVALSALALVMLALLLVEFAGLAPEWSRAIAVAQTGIWALFVLAFVVELYLSPSRVGYLRTHWLVLLSLALPFLRLFRVFRAFRVLRATRAVRSIALGRLLTTLNRARGALAQFIQFSQFVYLVALTIAVTLGAAAGALLLERGAPASSIQGFGDALWWAATLVTTVNAGVEPTTAEGRVLAVLLRLFGVSVIGYLTARLAAFLLRRDESGEAIPPDEAERRALREEMRELRRWLSMHPRPTPPARTTPVKGRGTRVPRRRTRRDT